ncbi:MAG: hypothetical protein CL902_02180 [Dehalococcoidia bacterium]|nr:hypothetical protein [Dehalococcoidia bacterium]
MPPAPNGAGTGVFRGVGEGSRMASWETCPSAEGAELAVGGRVPAGVPVFGVELAPQATANRVMALEISPRARKLGIK